MILYVMHKFVRNSVLLTIILRPWGFIISKEELTKNIVIVPVIFNSVIDL